MSVSGVVGYSSAVYEIATVRGALSLRGLFEDSCAEGGAKAHSQFGGMEGYSAYLLRLPPDFSQ